MSKLWTAVSYFFVFTSMALLILMAMQYFSRESDACTARGGLNVKTDHGYACIKAERI